MAWGNVLVCLDEWWIDEILYTGTTQKKQFSAPGSKKKKKRSSLGHLWISMNSQKGKRKMYKAILVSVGKLRIYKIEKKYCWSHKKK